MRGTSHRKGVNKWRNLALLSGSKHLQYRLPQALPLWKVISQRINHWMLKPAYLIWLQKGRLPLGWLTQTILYNGCEILAFRSPAFCCHLRCFSMHRVDPSGSCAVFGQDRHSGADQIGWEMVSLRFRAKFNTDWLLWKSEKEKLQEVSVFFYLILSAINIKLIRLDLHVTILDWWNDKDYTVYVYTVCIYHIRLQE